MSTGFFGDIAKIKFEGEGSTNPLAFRHYNPMRLSSESVWKIICGLRLPIGTLRLAGYGPVWRQHF